MKHSVEVTSRLTAFQGRCRGREIGHHMLLGILSDTHNELERTRTAVAMLQSEGVQALIHCGDLSSPPILAACAVLPVHFVFGNHDADSVPLLRQSAVELGAVCLNWGGIVEYAGKKIGVTHGHMTTDLRTVLKGNPDYVLSGHSHLACDQMVQGMRRINPGALHRADTFTVAVLDLQSDALRFLEVKA